MIVAIDKESFFIMWRKVWDPHFHKVMIENAQQQKEKKKKKKKKMEGHPRDGRQTVVGYGTGDDGYNSIFGSKNTKISSNSSTDQQQQQLLLRSTWDTKVSEDDNEPQTTPYTFPLRGPGDCSIFSIIPARSAFAVSVSPVGNNTITPVHIQENRVSQQQQQEEEEKEKEALLDLQLSRFTCIWGATVEEAEEAEEEKEEEEEEEVAPLSPGTLVFASRRHISKHASAGFVTLNGLLVPWLQTRVFLQRLLLSTRPPALSVGKKRVRTWTATTTNSPQSKFKHHTLLAVGDTSIQSPFLPTSLDNCLISVSANSENKFEMMFEEGRLSIEGMSKFNILLLKKIIEKADLFAKIQKNLATLGLLLQAMDHADNFQLKIKSKWRNNIELATLVAKTEEMGTTQNSRLGLVSSVDAKKHSSSSFVFVPTIKHWETQMLQPLEIQNFTIFKGRNIDAERMVFALDNKVGYLHPTIEKLPFLSCCHKSLQTEFKTHDPQCAYPIAFSSFQEVWSLRKIQTEKVEVQAEDTDQGLYDHRLLLQMFIFLNSQWKMHTVTPGNKSGTIKTSHMTVFKNPLPRTQKQWYILLNNTEKA